MVFEEDGDRRFWGMSIVEVIILVVVFWFVDDYFFLEKIE